MKIERVTLRSQHLRLEPLTAGHLPGLAEAIRDGELWNIPVTFVPHPDDLPAFLADADGAFAAQRELAFAIVDNLTARVLGSTRFRCIEAVHKRVEIGFTFLAQSSQRTYVNSEAKYALLEHAFDDWQCNRVELLTDVLNEKSRRAIARIGAREEGVLRSHMVMRDGRVRDSVVFSIVRSEWSSVQRALRARIGF